MPVVYKDWKLPEGEQHIQELIDLDYETKKYHRLKPFLLKRRLALDVGAHIGWWSSMLVKDFEEVIAFEPIKEHIECWMHNVGYHGGRKTNIKLIETALGAFPNVATLTEGREGNTGMRYMAVGSGDITVDFLDGLIPPEFCDKVDFIKIDTEGMEFDVLRGAQEILTFSRPVVYFEEKGHSDRYGWEPNSARRFLETLNYELALVDGSDFLMVPK